MDLSLNKKLIDAHFHYYDSFNEDIIDHGIVCHNPKCNHTTFTNIQFTKLFKAIGIHPWFVNNISITNIELSLENSSDNIIGEIGLDFSKKSPFHEMSLLQEEILIEQLTLSKINNSNIILHCVKCWHRILPILEKNTNKSQNIMFHSFNANSQIIKKLLMMDNIYYSISSKSNLEILDLLPKNRLLIESDYDGEDCNEHITNLENMYRLVAKKLAIDIVSLSTLTEVNLMNYLKLQEIE